ncbi:J domain-containing protein [Synechococcus sp. ATX 2A4]|nr:J domain-containing protein [Synechococcus sp. ATX 2A4]
MDHWSTLGLEPGADAAALKRAFRQQARRWHPDLNGNDPVAEERFKRVNEAYAVLSDSKRRQAWERGQEAGGPQSGSRDRFASGFPPFEEYLEALFGRTTVPSPDGNRGTDDDPQDFAGAEPTEPFDADAAAPASRGRERSGGRVTQAPASPPPVQASADLESSVELTPEQALAGERLELALPDGTVVELWTPPLAGDGWRLRLAGVAPGGADHFIQLRVRTAEGLRIDGLRVLYTLDLFPPAAALGCRAVVPTLQGDVQLTVPPGSSSGRLLRLRGRGLAHLGQRGDQLVEIRIVVPEQLNDAEASLYRRLEQLAEQAEAEADGD